MRKFFTSGSRRYALALVFIGASFAIMGLQCQPTKPPPPTGLSISPTAHDFGSLKFGTQAPAQTFTVTNNGPDAAGRITFSVPDPGAAGGVFGFSNNTCSDPVNPVHLAAGQDCHITVSWAPLAIGNFTLNGSLGVTADPGGTATATLSGQGHN